MQSIKNAQLVNFELYDLKHDLGERHDLADKMPDRLKELSTQMIRKYREVQREGPTWDVPARN